MTDREMLAIVQGQLASALNCTVADLNGEKDGFVFVEAKENPGAMLPVPRGRQYFGMLTMGKSIIVTATPARLEYAREQLTGKSRDDAFSMPFICGHSLFYLPDLDNLRCLPPPSGFLYETAESDEIPQLRGATGFTNAIQHDLSHPYQNTLVMLARQGRTIAAMAGSGTREAHCSQMWAIGVDVLPEYRNRGLAAYLVNALALEVLKRNIVPYYGTTSSNIASQKVAHRAGFAPAWMCDHKVRFDGGLSNS